MFRTMGVKVLDECVCVCVLFSYQLDAIADVIEEDDPKRSRLRHVEVVDLVGRFHNHLVAGVYSTVRS